MSDPNDGAAEPAAGASPMATEIGRALGSIWQRREGTRPASVQTVIKGDAVRCVIDAQESEDEAGSSGNHVNAYKTEATAAVSRITRRTVFAYIAGRDKDTGNATQTFILERVRKF